MTDDTRALLVGTAVGLLLGAFLVWALTAAPAVLAVEPHTTGWEWRAPALVALVTLFALALFDEEDRP